MYNLERIFKATTYSNHNFNIALNFLKQNFNLEDGFILHSDRGVQYASYDYQDLLTEKGCIQIMSVKGGYNNACAETFYLSN